jgi:hypothetical protein
VGYALGYTPLSVTGSVTGATSQAQAFTNGITASALSTLTLTTEQLRLAYDGTHYASFTVGSAGNLTLGGTTGKLSVTAFQLGTSTTSGYVLTADSSGNGTWKAAAGAGANTALSNLSAVAINTSLLPGSAAGASLGSAGYPFQYLYLAGASGTPGSNNFLLTGTATAARTITFPDTTDTVAVLGTAQTYTATQTEKSVIWSNNAITCSSNAATVPITYRLNTITNNSAGNMTITMTTAGATDGQLTLIRIYDFSGVSETITWVNTENSNYASAPLTSNGSTTLPLTVGLQYNGATSLWRVIANT